MAQDERSEVAAAGHRALASLERAADALGSASRWGVFDIFLGGAVSSLVKHAHLGEAREALQAARDDLYDFTNELRGHSGIEALRVEVGTLNTVLDILLDNPVVDLYVQKKIDDAQDEVDAAIAATRTLLARIEGGE